MIARVIIALPEIAPGVRKQLIQSDVAFALSYKQGFAPQLWMMLKERFGAEPCQAHELRPAPAAQALLVWFLSPHRITKT